MNRIREWLTEEPGRHYLWTIALIVECLVDAENNKVFRSSELHQNIGDNWDSRVVSQIGKAINDHVGFLLKD